MNIKYNIVIATGGIEFNGGSLSEKAMGGSETAVIYVASEFAKMGHNVKVFCNCDKPGDYDGVQYLEIDKWSAFVNFGECDILIISRFFDLFKDPVNAKLKILWNHDILTEKDPLLSILYNIDYMYCLSDFHRKQYLEMIPDIEDLIKIIPNGIDRSIICKRQKKDRIMFTSRPERGLFKALRIFEKLDDKNIEFMFCNYQTINDPEVHKIEDICYEYISELVKKGFKISMAQFTKEQLYEYISESKAVLYPTQFPEIFCISALEAQANHTCYISTDDFALPEIIKTASTRIENWTDENESDEKFISTLKSILYNDDIRRQIEDEGYDKTDDYSWIKVASKFIDDADEYFASRSTNDSRGVIDRLMYESDLLVARDLAVKVNDNERIEQLNHLLRFVDNPDQYKQIYEDESTHEKIDMDISQIETNTRFQWLSKKIKEHKVESLLDFACHMGWSSIYVSNNNPDCKIIGYDISERAIEKAKTRTKFMKHPDNIHFTNDLNLIEQVRYDAVFAGEFLEHTLNPEVELKKLQNYVRPGGKIFFTVPKGAWEKLSHIENIEKDRVFHVQSFDLRDIHKMVGKKPDFKFIITQNFRGMYNEAMGNYCVEYTNDEHPIGHRDFSVKQKLTRPYQSISACIIARNAEKEIERMLDSINFEVDEIIIGLDHNRGENRILEDRILSYKKARIVYLPARIQDPDYCGFAEARNFVCSSAKSKWIFWIDTDEILLKAYPFRMFLDNTHFNSFVIRQHHTQFDNFIEADSPSRIFRKGSGEFVGYIHEQVMKLDDINEPVGPGLILTLADILNFGEINEGMRRDKALGRNLKLLEKDIKENVDDKKRVGKPYRKLSLILLMRDFVNRMVYAKERFGTFQCEDVLKISFPNIQKIYDEYFLSESSKLYKELAFQILQRAYDLIEYGDKIEIERDGIKYSFRIKDFELSEIKKILGR
jgi:glycosyltransferase involved in cell wall biosynthesis/cyclopropane fatty-acyl-phospholipid synthase-like methyltransferase